MKHSIVKSEKKQNIGKLLNFKNTYRGIWTAYFGLGLFVSPWFLLAGVPYAIYRLVNLLDFDRKFHYVQWKKNGYGKSDKNLTFRKLIYLTYEGQKQGINGSYAYENFEKVIKRGKLLVTHDIHMQIETDEMKTFLGGIGCYSATLYYKNMIVDSAKGFSFNRIKWDLEDFPDIADEIRQYLLSIEDKLSVKKLTKKEQVVLQAKERRKLLAEEVRRDYLNKNIK